MSVESTNNIFIGSIIQAINKEWVHGSTDSKPVTLLNLLVQAFFYALDQYNSTEDAELLKKYQCILEKINEKILDLKNKCPEICNYKDRIVVTRNWNTPPTIEDNIILLPISNSLQALNYNEVIFNYNDAENDLISQVAILSKETTGDLNIDNTPVVINQIYPPNINFSIKYNDGSGNTFIPFTDDGGENCDIISVNQEDLEELEGYVVTLDDNGEVIFQHLDNDSEEIPNDTIVYAHVDASSMKAVDQDLLKNILLDWWEGFRTANPDFNGSFLISTVPNSDIPGSNYAPGRGANNYVTITGGSSLWNPLNAQEDWLKTPTQALLRQAYKEGLSSMTEPQFLSYIEGKSLVVLSFIDESSGNYHGSTTVQGFTSNGIIQPTPYYITDYSGFLFKVRPRLGFFKGVQYPLIRTTGVVSSFLLHSLAAIEATILNPTQIDNLVGPDVVDAFGPTFMNIYFYSHLGAGNPYSFLNGLKDAGWEANFTKLTSNNAEEPTEAFTSGEFASELNDILTSTGDVEVSTLDINTTPSTNLGEEVDTEFSLKVRDNSSIQPLWSNEADITVIFQAACAETPDCTATIPTITIPHKTDYTFVRDNFTSELNVNKVKITSISVPSGSLRWYSLPVTPGILPITIPMSDIVAGHLTYTSDISVQDSVTIELEYQLSYNNSYSFSDTCEFELTKTPNPNTPPIIVSPNVEIEVKCGGGEGGEDELGEATLNTTITYTGTGGYNLYWTKVSGPAGSTNEMINPLVEDLQLHNLLVGTYVFRLTVVTNEDFFIVTHDVTVTVVCEQQEEA